jgi:hypothetical protein
MHPKQKERFRLILLNKTNISTQTKIEKNENAIAA